MIDKEQLLSLVMRHLGLKNCYPAVEFKGQGWKFRHIKSDWAVMMVRARTNYYDCMIWHRADAFMAEKRPDCDERVYVSIYGSILPKPSTGRRRAPKSLQSLRVYIGVKKHVHDILCRVPRILRIRETDSNKAALTEHAYKWALRQAKGDYGIHAKKDTEADRDHSYGGWVICYGDGEQITTNPCQYEWEAWSHAYNSMISGIVEPLLLDS